MWGAGGNQNWFSLRDFWDSAGNGLPIRISSGEHFTVDVELDPSD
jgi:hypothetical protein